MFKINNNINDALLMSLLLTLSLFLAFLYCFYCRLSTVKCLVGLVELTNGINTLRNIKYITMLFNQLPKMF